MVPLFILGVIASFLSAIAVGIVIDFGFLKPPVLTPQQQRLLKVANQSQALWGDGRSPYKDILKGSKYKFTWFKPVLQLFPNSADWERLIQQAGIEQPIDVYLVNRVLLPMIGLLLVSVLFSTPFLLLAIPVIPFAVLFWLRFKRQKRFDKLVQQLPDLLGMLSSSIKAGYSFQGSLGTASEEIGEPTSGELVQVIRELNLGLPIREVLERLMEQVDELPDYRMFVTSVTIQRETGGNLIEVLSRLGETVRQRFKLKGQIASLTAQSRATGFLIGAAPTVMLVVLSLFFPSYVAPLYQETLGNWLLVVALILQVIGFMIIRRIVDIKY